MHVTFEPHRENPMRRSTHGETWSSFVPSNILDATPIFKHPSNYVRSYASVDARHRAASSLLFVHRLLRGLAAIFRTG